MLLTPPAHITLVRAAAVSAVLLPRRGWVKMESEETPRVPGDRSPGTPDPWV